MTRAGRSCTFDSSFSTLASVEYPRCVFFVGVRPITSNRMRASCLGESMLNSSPPARRCATRARRAPAARRRPKKRATSRRWRRPCAPWRRAPRREAGRSSRTPRRCRRLRVPSREARPACARTPPGRRRPLVRLGLGKRRAEMRLAQLFARVRRRRRVQDVGGKPHVEASHGKQILFADQGVLARIAGEDAVDGLLHIERGELALRDDARKSRSASSPASSAVPREVLNAPVTPGSKSEA